MSGARGYAIGYSTCGFAPGRDVVTLLEVLADLGYEGVELELDRARLHPHLHEPADFRRVAAALRRTGLRPVLGTGGRHVLTDVRHHPGAVSAEAADRRRWLDFIGDSLELASTLECPCVMIHSGYAPRGVSPDLAWSWLIEGMAELAERARRHGVKLALEWHPEMFVRTAADYRRVAREVSSPALGCTLDVGHAHCTEEEPLAAVIASLAGETFHVQLEDMKDRVHKHLVLGAGQIDFGEVFDAFDHAGFDGVVALEFNAGDLGGEGDELARDSLGFLRQRIAGLAVPPAQGVG